MKATWRFFIASVALFALWASADAAYVFAGQPKGGTDPFDFLFFPVAYLEFFWAAWPLFPGLGRHARTGLRTLCALIAFVLWFLPATLALVQFHVAIGGVL